VINVQMLSGRTTEQRAILISELAETAKRVLGVPDEALRIILTEIAPENWGIGCRTIDAVRAGPQAVGEGL
jgi:4-oxalocrotonate tautomerase